MSQHLSLSSQKYSSEQPQKEAGYQEHEQAVEKEQVKDGIMPHCLIFMYLFLQDFSVSAVIAASLTVIHLLL